MAIKLVDVEPEGAPKPKRLDEADAPPVLRKPDAEALEQALAPERTHPKPESKP